MAELPTKEDLGRLSLRAIVAYAARCARRVQPLYRSAAAEHQQAVDQAIAFAETYATGAATTGNSVDSLAVANAASHASVNADAAATNAAAAANAAADAAGYAADIATANAANAAVNAAAYAAAANAAAYAADIYVYANAAFGDYKCLLRNHARGENWPGEPVDLSLLGPLWPGGGPGWFKGRSSGMEAEIEPLEFLLDPGDATPEEVANLLCDISLLYEMMGGLGVQFTVTDCRESVEELV